MKTRDNAYEILGSLYSEGDEDWLSFGEILEAVTFDGDERPFDKSELRRFNDAVKLVEFLVRSGGFVVGRLASSNGEKKGGFVPFLGGFDEFVTAALGFFKSGGIGDSSLNFGIWLDKITDAMHPAAISDDVSRIFASRVRS